MDLCYVFCCNFSKISHTHFQAGHIIPKSKGGSNTIDNIMPICSQCNGSMMTQNMGYYIKKYYPNNYSNFINKTYNPITNTNTWSFLGNWNKIKNNKYNK